MRSNVYMDSEFYEDGSTIDLISIGLWAPVPKEGIIRTFYAEVEDFDWDRVPADHWIQENVRPHISGQHLIKKVDLAGEIQSFIEELGPNLRFWGYYADYDWVVFCQIFGRMVDLPAEWPKFCMDLKQLVVQMGIKEVPQPESFGHTEHNAYQDAGYNFHLHQWLKERWAKRER